MTINGEKNDIRALQLAYAVTFDGRDPEGFAALYTTDAVITQPSGKTFAGHEKLRKAVRNMPPANGGFHHMLECEISIDGDAASGRCKYIARTADGRYAAGYYDDSYRRTGEGWRIAMRAVMVERWITPSEAEEQINNFSE